MELRKGDERLVALQICNVEMHLTHGECNVILFPAVGTGLCRAGTGSLTPTRARR